MSDDLNNLNQEELVELAKLYGIEPYVVFKDVWPFGDPHDVGKVHPELVSRIRTREAEIARLRKSKQS